MVSLFLCGRWVLRRSVTSRHLFVLKPRTKQARQIQSLARSSGGLAAGSSQTSRVLKSVVYYGFNTLNKRLVLDGLQLHIGQSGTMPYIPPPGASQKTVDLTITGDSSVYPFTYQEVLAPIVKEGLPTPKIIATNVEGDYYRRRLSLVRTGGYGGATDVPLPPTVRMWDIAGGSHGIITAAAQQSLRHATRQP